jgi:hypothetical protein
MLVQFRTKVIPDSFFYIGKLILEAQIYFAIKQADKEQEIKIIYYILPKACLRKGNMIL